MNNGRLRRRCERLIRRLALPSGVDLAGLRAHLERSRQRTITLVPLCGLDADGPCGVWVATPAADFVLFRDDTSPWHQSHIILHELSHLIFDHVGMLGGDYQRLLVPHLEPAAIGRMLGRGAYTVQEEREAETLASLLAQHISRAPGPVGHEPEQRLKELLE